jgi:hypothetical protein
MKRTIGILFLFISATLFAQDSASDARIKAQAQKELEAEQAHQLVAEQMAAGKQTVTKAITLKYPNRVNTNVLDGIGLVIKQSGDIVVITGPPERVDTAEAILKQLDVPPPPPSPVEQKKDIQLTAYMIIASPSATTGTPVPKDLDSAISQVSSIFPYKSFNMFDAVLMRMVEGEGRDASRGHVSGALPQGQQTFAGGGSYDFSVQAVGLTPATPANLLRLHNLSLQLRILAGVDKDGKDKYQQVNIDTNIDMKEGQKIVVGKANIDGSENALIVILTAKVVD